MRLLFCFFFLQISSALFAQQFQFEEFLSSDFKAVDVEVGDIDNDGNVDVLLADEDRLAYIRNNGFYFEIPVLIDNDWNISELHLVDMDGDGLKDLVYLASQHEIRFRKNEGEFNFSSPQVLFELGSTWQLNVADISGDSLPEIVFTDSFSDDLRFILNLGGASFSQPIDVDLQTFDFGNRIIDDFNNDGHSDLLYFHATVGDIIMRYGNSTAVFSVLVPFNFNQNFPEFQVHDYDLDGDLDFFGISNDDIVVRATNEGNYQFSAFDTLYSEALAPNEIFFNDYDFDGDEDLILSVQGALLWSPLENGEFGDWNIWTESVNTVTGFEIADLDNDSLNDVLVSSLHGRVLAYYNLGSNYSDKKHLNPFMESVDQISHVDLNGDGDLDIVATDRESNRVLNFDNKGNGKFRIKIMRSIPEVGKSIFEDLNDDGNVDMLVISGNDVNFLPGGPNGFLGVQNSVSGFLNPVDIELAFIDDDSLLDLVIVYQNPFAQLAWSKNLGGANFQEPLFLTEDYPLAQDVIVHDFDLDGDDDLILSDSSSGAKLIFFKNLGNNEFEIEELDFSNMGAVNIALLNSADIDNDGLKDLVFTLNNSLSANQVLKMKNLGNMQFDSAQEIYYYFSGAIFYPYFVHLNNDTILDMALANTNDNVILFQGTGNGNFSEFETIEGDFNNLSNFDTDNDSDKDLIISYWNNSSSEKVAIYENKMGLGCTDSLAINFNPDAYEDDGSCCFEIPSGEVFATTDYFCFGEMTQLYFDSDFQVNWLFANGSVSQVDTLNIFSSTDMQVFFTQGACNSDTLSISVEEAPFIPEPIVNLINPILCEGENMTLQAENIGPFGASWFLNDSLISEEEFATIDTGGLVQVVLNNNACSSDTLEFEIFLAELPAFPNFVLDNGVLSTYDDPTLYYQWYFEDSLLVNENMNSIIPFADGVYSVVITDLFSTCFQENEVLVIINSLDELETTLRIYPNPAKDQFTIEFFNAKPDQMRLLNAGGELMQNFDLTNQESVYGFKRSKESPGVYFLEIQKSNKTHIHKIILE